MPKLLKHMAYSYRKKTGEDVVHYKYMVVIPEEAKKKANWQDGQELDFDIQNDTIALRPRKSRQIARKRNRKSTS
jgi:bifunctional DNA-binding transcriptional regulator/antitoxin component of YhaV-PrlF toxin-antitoxin module